MALRFRVLTIFTLALSSWAALAAQSEYYTMVSGRKDPRECTMEGNQIVNGVLIGSDCSDGGIGMYCPYGVGNRSNCIVPCVHCVGPQRLWGRSIAIRPVTCPWGPLKGSRITSCIVADSGPGHVDMFVGLCRKKKRGSDRCERFAPDTAIASYGSGRGREYEIAAELVNRFAPGKGKVLMAMVGLAPISSTGTATPPASSPPRRAPAPAPAPAPPVRNNVRLTGDWANGSSSFLFSDSIR